MPTSPVRPAELGLRLIRFWIDLAVTVAMAFMFSYFWTATTAIYFLLRRHVDATEMDEVYIPEEGRSRPAAARSRRRRRRRSWRCRGLRGPRLAQRPNRPAVLIRRRELGGSLRRCPPPQSPPPCPTAAVTPATVPTAASCPPPPWPAATATVMSAPAAVIPPPAACGCA